MDEVLPRLVSYENILRGKIFNVATPFTEGRPLSFVVQDGSNPGLYKIIKKLDGFEGEIDPITKKKKAPVVQAVMEYKIRLGIVIQNDKLNHDPDYKSVIVIPIASIYEEDKKDPLIIRAMTKNDVDLIHYLQMVTGREAYAQVNNPRIVYKNMLFEPPKQIILHSSMMDEIVKKLASCLQIKKIKECEDCKYNCKKCEYKLAVNK
jgi:hypothetical protein